MTSLRAGRAEGMANRPREVRRVVAEGVAIVATLILFAAVIFCAFFTGLAVLGEDDVLGPALKSAVVIMAAAAIVRLSYLYLAHIEALADSEDRLVVTDWPDAWSGNTVEARDIAEVTASIDALLHRRDPEDRPAVIVFDIDGRDDPELTNTMNTAVQHARQHNGHVTIIVDETARPSLT